MYEKRARDILFGMYWKGGWKGESERTISADDFAYAKSQGYMFDDIRTSHDQLVRQLIDERDRANQLAIANAFLASFGNRRLDWRSALGSYAFALNFPAHQIANTPQSIAPSGAKRCEWCGFYEFDQPKEIDLNVLNFERYKWGGVRRDDPAFAWFDLFLFRSQPHSDELVSSDKHKMREVLRTARSMEPNATAGALEKALTGIFDSSKQERRGVIEILALCGILQPANRSGYFGEFTLAFERDHTGQHTNDWGYPARWWRGADGVNEAAVADYFPDL